MSWYQCLRNWTLTFPFNDTNFNWEHPTLKTSLRYQYYILNVPKTDNHPHIPRKSQS